VRINLRHDSLGESNCIRNSALGCRRIFPIPLCQLPSRQNAGSDKDYALSACVHDNESSLFVFCSPPENLRIFSAPSTRIPQEDPETPKHSEITDKLCCFINLRTKHQKRPLPNSHLTLRCASGIAGTQGTGIVQTLPNAVLWAKYLILYYLQMIPCLKSNDSTAQIVSPEAKPV
jgi:hypothetical protein